MVEINNEIDELEVVTDEELEEVTDEEFEEIYNEVMAEMDAEIEKSLSRPLSEEEKAFLKALDEAENQNDAMELIYDFTRRKSFLRKRW